MIRIVLAASVLCNAALGAQHVEPGCPPTPPRTSNQTYFACQVDHPATWAAGSLRPKVPPMMHRGRVDGRVRMQFVIDGTGAVDTATIRVLAATHDDFVLARPTVARCRRTIASRSCAIVRNRPSPAWLICCRCARRTVTTSSEIGHLENSGRCRRGACFKTNPTRGARRPLCKQRGVSAPASGLAVGGRCGDTGGRTLRGVASSAGVDSPR
jgi:hypothetical protein